MFRVFGQLARSGFVMIYTVHTSIALGSTKACTVPVGLCGSCAKVEEASEAQRSDLWAATDLVL